MRCSVLLILGGLLLASLAPIQAQDGAMPIRLVHERAEAGETVTIRGEIVRRLRGRSYLVADGTGEIRVIVNADLHRLQQSWVGVHVEVLGEVERRRGRARIRAERIVVFNRSTPDGTSSPEGEQPGERAQLRLGTLRLEAG